MLLRSFFVVGLIAFVSFVSYAQMTVQPPTFDFSTAWERGIQPTNNPTNIYADSPSIWIGNLFNQTIGTTTPDVRFNIEEGRTFPSFSGAQLWIRVTSDDISECNASADTECWVRPGYN